MDISYLANSVRQTTAIINTNYRYLNLSYSTKEKALATKNNNKN